MLHLAVVCPLLLLASPSTASQKEESAACAGGNADSCSNKEQAMVLDENDEALHWLRRCNIERRSWPAPGQMLSTKETEPYIVTLPPGRNAKLAAMMTRESLLSEMGDMDCTPSQVGNVRRGIHNMRLREYIEDWMDRPVDRNPELNRYVFGEFGEEWAPFRDAYVLPQCKACTRKRVAITIGLGGLHTGAPWHFHDAAFVEVLHGRKHFAFLKNHEPEVAMIDEAIQNSSQLHWYLEDRPRLESKGYLRSLQECTIEPGELLYFPNQWHHGVLNLEAHTAFVSTFLDRGARED